MEFLNAFDYPIVTFINSFAGKSAAFDRVMVSFTEVGLVKGGVVTALLCYAWVVPEWRLAGSRMVFARSAIGIMVAVFLSRGLARVLPFHFHPRSDPGLDFVLPIGKKAGELAELSSFPSDHATLYFAVATAIFIVDRRVGVFAFVWTVIFTCLPRVYAGSHYPSDLIAGALLGSAIMWLAFRVPLPSFVPEILRRWEDRHAASLYALAFLFAFQVTSTFNGASTLAKLGLKILTGAEL